jgi:hypothetical protein
LAEASALALALAEASALVLLLDLISGLGVSFFITTKYITTIAIANNTPATPNPNPIFFELELT